MKEKNGACAGVKIHILSLISFLTLIAADQATKGLACTGLKGKAPLKIWEGVFSLKYLENKGAAFGLMQGGGPVFLVMGIVILLLVGDLYRKIPALKKFYLLRACLVLLCSGALGNIIDRLKMGYVRDFIYFELINFPIFNLADSYITVSAVLFIFLFMFYYKEDDIYRLISKGGKK